ncbi:HAMP domain-containing histidine kinase [Actinomadura darangshiensis]|uniref:histidine kinase n=1 Tax=Actinomadura darangshiensis TaxID=705336 RepID=A0A4R5BB89_9ACTN|nr:HAMP domain-containing sensor histidine kinase [Actinomadura darangshiensis]TDD82785.1 HAMP domain-containing histidine kinase [Actinomadura darangshiensis]
MNNGRARSSPADAPAGVGTLAGAAGHGAHDHAGASGRGAQVLWRRRLRHDIRHELGTIIMLASAVVVADDVGDTSRARIDQLLGETRWLDHLLRRLDEDDTGYGGADRPPPAPERIRVDDLTAEVVTGMRLATPHEVCFTGGEAWAHMDPVALWRAVRNVLDNACRVAEGRVNVGVEADRGWVVIQVDDDGPGFGAGPGRGTARPGLASLGLGIVHDLISGYGGSLEIRTCEMGGARVRMLLPAAPPPESVVRADSHADDWRPHP